MAARIELKAVCIAAPLHPGIINSELWKTASSGIMEAISWGIAKCFLTSLEVGTYNNVFCAPSLEVTMEDAGDYYVPVAVKGTGMMHTPSPAAGDEELAEKLWERPGTEVGKYGY